MTPEDHKLLRRIEEDERLLAACWQDPPPPDVERIKQRVHLAVDEAWLERRLDDVAPKPHLAGRTKIALHAELARLRRETASAKRPRWPRLRVQLFRLSGSLAAAAALALAFVIWWSSEPAPPTLLSTVSTDVFEAYELDDEFFTELALLEEELDELELMELGISGDELQDTLIDDVGDSIDDLLLDTETTDDLLGETSAPSGRDMRTLLG